MGKRWKNLSLDPALEKRVLHLARHQRRTTRECGLPRTGPGRLPSGVVRDAHVAGSTGAHSLIGRRQGLLDWCPGIPCVELPEVYVVGAEPSERVVKGRKQMSAGGVEAASRTWAAGGFGRDDDVASGYDVPDQLTQNSLGRSIDVDISG